MTYLADTILPYAEMILDEFNTKLFKPSQIGKYEIGFDYTKLIVANNESKVKYYTDLLKNGVLSLNEVRDALGYDPIEGEEGNARFIQLSYATVKDIAEGKYIKQNSQSQNQNVDNQAKQEK